MGFSFGGRWLRVRVGKRGASTSVGPRALRYHRSRTSRGVSTGLGPFSVYKGRKKRH